MTVAALTAADLDWAESFMGGFGGRMIARDDELVDGLAHPGFRHGDDGLLLYIDGTDSCELLYLSARRQWTGVGTALVDALVDHRPDIPIRVSTTNDNVDALRFYQRRGFRLRAVRVGAVDRARSLKPSIPLVGDHGIPLRDEIELERPAR